MKKTKKSDFLKKNNLYLVFTNNDVSFKIFIFQKTHKIILLRLFLKNNSISTHLNSILYLFLFLNYCLNKKRFLTHVLEKKNNYEYLTFIFYCLSKFNKYLCYNKIHPASRNMVFKKMYY